MPLPNILGGNNTKQTTTKVGNSKLPNILNSQPPVTVAPEVVAPTPTPEMPAPGLMSKIKDTAAQSFKDTLLGAIKNPISPGLGKITSKITDYLSPIPTVEDTGPAKAYGSDLLDKTINAGKSESTKYYESLKDIPDEQLTLSQKYDKHIIAPINKTMLTAGAGFVQGLSALPKAVANIEDLAAGKALDQNRWVDRLAATGSKYAQAIDSMAGFNEAAGGEAKPFGYKVSSGSGNMASNLIPAGAVGKGANLLTAAVEDIPKLAKFAPTIGKWVAQGTLVAQEAAQEAGSVYDDVLQKTGDKAKALLESQKTSLANVALIGITNKYAGYFEDLAPGVKNVVKRVLASFAFEGGQEGGQQMISNMASDKPLFEGVQESSLIGGILGSGGSLATANVFNQDGTVNKEKVIEVLQKEGTPVELTPKDNVEQAVTNNVPAPVEDITTATNDIPAPTEDTTVPWDDSQEKQIVDVIHEEVTPLVEQFNQLTPQEQTGPVGEQLQTKIDNLETDRENVIKQYKAKLVSENVKETKAVDYNPETQVKIAGEVFSRPKGLVSKHDLKKILSLTGKESVDMTVEEYQGNKVLQYKEGTTTIKLRLSALGLVNNSNLQVGDTVSVAQEDLNAKGLAKDNSIRAIGSNGEVLASKGSKQIDKYEKVAPSIVKPENFKIYKEVEGLIRKYATRVAEGNVVRGALGTHNTKTGTIRLKGLNNFSVAVHEITHNLDLMNSVTDGAMNIKGYSISGSPIYTPDTADMRKSLSEIYLNEYPGAKSSHGLQLRMREGYAMLLQRYTESPEYTTIRYPLAVKEFLNEGGKFYKPVIGDILKDLKNIVSNYQSLSASEKIGARLTEDNNITGKESFLNMEEQVRTTLVDAIYPIEKLAKQAGVDIRNNPSTIIRHYGNVNSYFSNNVEGDNGYWTFNGSEFSKKYDYNWGTLMKDLEAKKARVEFDQWLVARRTYYQYQAMHEIEDNIEAAQEEYQKSITDKEVEVARDIKDSIDTMEENRAKLESILKNDQIDEQVATEAYFINKDKFVKEEEMFDNLINADLQLLNKKSIGLLSDEEYTKLSNVKGYAAFKREFYNDIVGDESVTGKVAGKGKVSVLKNRTGSTRTIISPILSGVKSHSEILQKSMTQYVHNKMGELVKSGKVDNLMEIVPLKITKDESTGAIIYPQERDPNIIMARIDGKRVPIQTDSFIKNSLDGLLDYSSVDAAAQLMKAANRTFTKGTTSLFAYFPFVNTIVDQITAKSNTVNGYTPFVSPAKMLYKALLKKDTLDAQYFKEYLVLVGDRLYAGKAMDMSAKEMAEYIAGERTGINKVLDRINRGLDILSIPSQTSESITRGAEYVAARKAGKSQVEAMDNAAELTTNFGRVGKWGSAKGKEGFMRTIVRSIPYFNASMQVTDKVYRQLKTEQGRKQVAMVTSILTAAQVAAMAILIGSGTDEQKNIFKDLNSSDLSKYIYFPSTDGKTLVKIRMPDAFMMPGAVVNMLIGQKYLDTKYTTNDFIDAMTAFVPQQMNILKPTEAFLAWVPQLIKPTAQVVLNYSDFPRLRPLEGLGQQRKPDEMRFTQSTPLLTKMIGTWTGKHLGISPIELDNLIVGYLGRTTNFVTGKPGIYNPMSIFTQKKYFEGGRIMQNYYEVKKSIDEDYTSYVSAKKKNKETLVGKEATIDEIRNKIYGYGRGEDKVLGVQDYIEQYQDSVKEGDNKKANELMDVIIKGIYEINKYKR